ncbi:hypothetical protein GTP91_11420 [Rugamonas sp. FT82W]|uniref:DUF2306 domain-containing protein n=1 Tax=Duganella vulcania TaxID=2692166 RepID=A0A845G4H7_9BURK|nr:hypothetical protein [Duganella vulcania]MYM87789.1 hypothetical protein [Duganella vulcania]
MFGLTSLGIIHTVISLIAVGAGIVGFLRDRRVDLDTGAGKIYLWTTVATCITGFGVFQHGGFGKPHALGVLTLLLLGAAWTLRGRVVPQTVLLSTTFFFHLIPAMTETLTRLPLGAPLLKDAEAPELKAITGILFLLLVIGVTLQVRWLKQVGRTPGQRAAV